MFVSNVTLGGKVGVGGTTGQWIGVFVQRKNWPFYWPREGDAESLLATDVNQDVTYPNSGPRKI